MKNILTKIQIIPATDENYKFFRDFLCSEEQREWIYMFETMGDEYNVYKKLAEKLEKDPCFIYDLSLVLQLSGIEAYEFGNYHDEQNKGLTIPSLHCVLKPVEYFDNDDQEWLVKKVEVIRL